MSDRKFTDDEVIKALEWCIQSESCEYCEYREKTNKVDVCTIKQDALALINRQKAEIERLKYNLKAVLEERADHTEAIKEFAERLKLKFRIKYTHSKPCEDLIDNLVKEMTEGGEPRKDVGK